MLNTENLNDAQRMAVMHGEGPLLVLAGPGSGKTHTIVQRIFYLLEVRKVAPEEILVLTFTKEAAVSMQKRFCEEANQVYPVNFGTFHSIFYHILKQSGISKYKQLLNEAQKRHLIYPILKKYSMQTNNRLMCDKENQNLLLNAISLYKNTGNFEDVRKGLPLEWRELFSCVFREYEGEREHNRAMDFDDMVYECERLLREDQQMRTYWQNRFSHILIDEFQDINPMQYRVIKCLAKPPYSLFAVGDDDQSIYGFRGAKTACLKDFMKEFDARRLLLNINYRSHNSIVRASLLVIAENKERFSKKLQAAVKDVSEEQQVQLLTFREREEQYQYLKEQLLAANKSEVCAVLFRTNTYLQEFAARLRRDGISYQMKEKAQNIYEKDIVQDVLAYLRVASGDKNRALWLRIINKPARYISREAFSALGETVTLKNLKEYYSGSTSSYSVGQRAALELLERQLAYLRTASPFLAVQYIRRIIGYDNYLMEKALKASKGRGDFEEEELILNWLCEEAKGFHTQKEWLKHQTEVSVTEDKRDEVNSAQDGKFAQILLMTVHASKGLEFDRVWIPDCNEKVFPHGAMPDKESCEEERRIFYVAMTRAKKHLELLCLTGSRERPRLPSRFLNPLWKDYSSSSNISSNSHLSKYSSKASSTLSYSSSSSI